MIDGGNHQNGNHSLIVNNTIVNNYASANASWGNTSALYYRDWTGQGQEKHNGLYAFNNIVYGNLKVKILLPLVFTVVTPKSGLIIIYFKILMLLNQAQIFL